MTAWKVQRVVGWEDVNVALVVGADVNNGKLDMQLEKK